MTLKELKAEFNEMRESHIPSFTFKVIDVRTYKEEYIEFNIELRRNTLFAYHIPLSEKQERSKFVAYRKVVLEKGYTLHHFLEELNEECTIAIIESEFYYFPKDDE